MRHTTHTALAVSIGFCTFLSVLQRGPARTGDADDKAYVTVESGVVAIAPLPTPGEQSAAKWAILSSGDRFAIGSAIRNTEAAASVLTLGEAKLHLAPGGWAKINSDEGLELLEGRLLVSTAARMKTNVLASGMVIHLGANSSAEIFVDQYHMARVLSLDGTVAVGATSVQNSQPLARDNTAIFDPAKKAVTVFALADAEKERARVTQWTSHDTLGTGLGQLLVTDPQSGAVERLNIARSHTHLVLAPPVALVQIDQSFYNPYPRSLEGTFVFNLPRGASVSRFAMYVGPHELVEGELIDRRRANDIYTSIVQNRRDPAILEQLGDNLFRMRVFPIFGQDVKRILLDFTLPLEMMNQAYEFRLPLLNDLQPIWDFGITGVITGPVRDNSVRSPTYAAIEFTPQADHGVSFALTRSEFRAPVPTW